MHNTLLFTLFIMGPFAYFKVHKLLLTPVSSFTSLTAGADISSPYAQKTITHTKLVNIDIAILPLLINENFQMHTPHLINKSIRKLPDPSAFEFSFIFLDHQNLQTVKRFLGLNRGIKNLN